MSSDESPCTPLHGDDSFLQTPPNLPARPALNSVANESHAGLSCLLQNCKIVDSGREDCRRASVCCSRGSIPWEYLLQRREGVDGISAHDPRHVTVVWTWTLRVSGGTSSLTLATLLTIADPESSCSWITDVENSFHSRSSPSSHSNNFSSMHFASYATSDWIKPRPCVKFLSPMLVNESLHFSCTWEGMNWVISSLQLLIRSVHFALLQSKDMQQLVQYTSAGQDVNHRSSSLPRFILTFDPCVVRRSLFCSNTQSYDACNARVFYFLTPILFLVCPSGVGGSILNRHPSTHCLLFLEPRSEIVFASFGQINV